MTKFSLICVAVYIAGICLVSDSGHADERRVSNSAEIHAALRRALPGDTLVMTDGVWQDADILFQGIGKAGAPITLRAETPGKVVLRGTSQLRIAGMHLVVDGLKFAGGQQSRNRVVSRKYGLALEPVVKVLKDRGGGKWTMGCRITNCAFIKYNPPDSKTIYTWVEVDGIRNRVDHCYFSGKQHAGRTVSVRNGVGEKAGYHQVDHNYFGDRPIKTGETIGVGTGGEGCKITRALVEHNLFYNCSGGTIISNKGDENTYRYNTFVECLGTLTLRHGVRCVVDGNFFLGNGVEGTGGIRVIDDYHTITNNYFAGLRGDGLRAVLCFHNGVSVYVPAGTIHAKIGGKRQVNKVLIAFNTFVDNRQNILFGMFTGSTMPAPPDGCIFANNIFSSREVPLIKVLDKPTNTKWQGNIFHGADLGIAKPIGITVVDPKLTHDDDGIYRPDRSSPAIAAAEGDYSWIKEDIDGQPRGKSQDVGCDQHSTQPMLRRPLTRRDVGPNWTVIEQHN